MVVGGQFQQSWVEMNLSIAARGRLPLDRAALPVVPVVSRFDAREGVNGCVATQFLAASTSSGLPRRAAS